MKPLNDSTKRRSPGKGAAYRKTQRSCQFSEERDLFASLPAQARRQLTADGNNRAFGEKPAAGSPITARPRIESDAHRAFSIVAAESGAQVATSPQRQPISLRSMPTTCFVRS